jgi:putative membrane protein
MPMMRLLSSIAVGLVAAIHVYILVLESFLWTTRRGLKTFKLTAEFARQTQPLALNQGLYNGFLAAGLVWGLAHPDESFAREIALFFLGCVFTAGCVGAATVMPKIFWIQSLPAAVAAAAVVFGF